MALAAQQFLRALRGKRSQRAFARRLGYRGNPITDWEHGRRTPTAREALRAARVCGLDVSSAFARFAPAAPLTLGTAGPQLGPWLRALSEGTSIAALAARSGLSRHAIGRWLRGERQPQLPEFFALLDAITARLPELVALLVPIAQVPALHERHARAEAARRLAFEEPWTEAILRVLESPQYLARPAHEPGYVARRLAIAQDVEARALSRLSAAGVVRWDGARYVADQPLTVDTFGNPEARRALRLHWGLVGAERTQQPGPADLFGYNVFGVSAADYDRIAERLRAVFAELRALVAASEPAEHVALLNLQLVRWEPEAEP